MSVRGELNKIRKLLAKKAEADRKNNEEDIELVWIDDDDPDYKPGPGEIVLTWDDADPDDERYSRG